MIEIPLTQGKVALIDDEDYELVSKHKWCAAKNGTTFYAQTVFRVNGKHKCILMHRLILGLAFGDKCHGDHRDGNGLDNRRANLRIAIGGQNQRNRRPTTNNSSRFKGVHLSKGGKLWRAEIGFNRKNHYIGLFKDEEEAARAYNAAALKHHGEFARLNILDAVEAKR